jgi:hypothetical protein
MPPDHEPRDLDAAGAVLAHWEWVDPVRHVSAVSRSGFSGAHVYRVVTDTAGFALRRWPSPCSLPEARLRELHRFLAFLQREGINVVAVPRAGTTGTLIRHAQHLWQLEPWMPGSAESSDSVGDGQLRSAMQTLARLHRAAARYEPTSHGREWFYQASAAPAPAVIERLQAIRVWTSDRFRMLMAFQHWFERDGPLLYWFELLAPAVRSELQRMASLAFPLEPCLRDVWSEHVLFTGDEVTGIIDPSAARSENVASDLSRLLGSLLPNVDEARWQQALDDYDVVRPLSLEERRLVSVLDRSGVLLSMLHWLEQLSVDRSLWTNPNVLQRIATVQLRLERMAAQAGSL